MLFIFYIDNKLFNNLNYIAIIIILKNYKIDFLYFDYKIIYL